MTPTVNKAGMLLLTLTSLALAADPSPAARRLAGGPFGLHGPTYSHMLHGRTPHLWATGETIFHVLRDSGAGWARQDFWWSLVEPEPGQFTWDDFDRAIDAYNRHGIRLLGILCYASAWSGGSSPVDDEARAQFANYVGQMVGRYKGRVAAWEIWNEPNIQPFWSPRPDPQLYTKLLIEAYRAAKSADPDCIVVGGGLAGPDVAFVEGMYANGAAGHFDVLSYHNYGQNLSLESEWPAVQALREVMSAHGDGEKPIWHTENGFYTGPVGLSEPEQAATVVRYSLGLLALGIERTFQLTLHDWSDDPHYHDQSSYRGLTHANLTPKPSFWAYRTMCARVGDKRFAGLIKPAPRVWGMLFRDEEGDTVAVLHTQDRRPAAPTAIEVGTPVALVQTMMGEFRRLESADGHYRLPIGGEPLYVFDPGLPLLAQAWLRWPDPLASRMSPDAEPVLHLEITNPGEDELVFSIPLARDGQTALIPAHSAESIALPLDLTNHPLGPHEVPWSLSIREESGDRPLARGYRTIDIESPLQLAFEPLPKLTEKEPRVPVRVTYRGRSKTAASLVLAIDGQPQGEAQALRLVPGESQVASLGLNLAALGEKPVLLGAVLDAAGIRLIEEMKRPLLKAPPAPQNAAVDGDLGEWLTHRPVVEPQQMSWAYVNSREDPPAEDLTVTAWAAHDARGLWIAVQVKDDVIELPRGRNVWEWDCLQVGLDLGADARPQTPYDRNDLEIELGQSATGEKWCYLGYCPPGWPEEALSAKLQGAVKVDEAAGTISYELLVPAELIVSATELAADTVIGFSIMVNDNDRDGRSGWQELTPGIGLGKNPWHFAWLWLR